MFTNGGIKLMVPDYHVRRIQLLLEDCHLMVSCVLVRYLSDCQISLNETHCVTIQSMCVVREQLTLNLGKGKMKTINKLDLIC